MHRHTSPSSRQRGTSGADLAWIEHVPGNAESSAIVAAIVAMATALGLDLVAEGVQTQAQRDCLTALGCPNAQGYLFAPGQSADQTVTLLKHGPFILGGTRGAY